MAVEEAEAEDAGQFAASCAKEDAPLEFPEEGVYVHAVLGTVHRYKEEGKAACGMLMKEIMYFQAAAAGDIEGCPRCWRPGCAPWLGVSRE